MQHTLLSIFEHDTHSDLLVLKVNFMDFASGRESITIFYDLFAEKMEK